MLNQRADPPYYLPVGESPYIDLGYGEELDTRQIRMVTGWIARDDELWQYYGGHQTGHTLARGRDHHGTGGLHRG